MEDNREERYEEKMRRYEASEERREERMLREEEKSHRTPWYSRGKVWMYIGVVVLCALLIYWVLFIAIWDGPNQ